MTVNTKLKFITLLLLLMWCFSFKVYAKDKIINTPQKYIINLIWISGTHPPEYIFAINGSIGFKTVGSLKEFVTGLPEGSILEWDPGCKRLGGEPLLSSKEEMNNFKSFCEEHKIIFNLIPSG